MTIKEALECLQQEQPIIVSGKTFEPHRIDEALLETGETLSWVYGKDGVWLSIDPESEEIVLFEDLHEDIEAEDEVVVYGGEDYEFSYEARVTILLEDGGTIINYKEYEGPRAVIRLMQDETTSDVTCSYGIKLTEEELQAA
jgi:hypothetical protein